MTPSQPRSLLARLIREPVVHFIVFGALVFGADHLLAARKDDPRTIVLGPEVDREIAVIYHEGKGHDPRPEEMKILRDRWLDNEVLYREGLALGVDRGDTSIRERVIFKALSVVQANLVLPKIDDAGLKAWYDRNRVHYEKPDRIDFEEAVLLGDRSETRIAAFVAALNKGGQAAAESGLRVFKGRPRESIVTSYGDAFTRTLEQLPVGAWQAVAAKDGVLVVRLGGVTKGEPITYEQVREAVYADWKDETMQALRTKAVRDLMNSKYRVRIAGEAK